MQSRDCAHPDGILECAPLALHEVGLAVANERAILLGRGAVQEGARRGRGRRRERNFYRALLVPRDRGVGRAGTGGHLCLGAERRRHLVRGAGVVERPDAELEAVHGARLDQLRVRVACTRARAGVCKRAREDVAAPWQMCLRAMLWVRKHVSAAALANAAARSAGAERSGAYACARAHCSLTRCISRKHGLAARALRRVGCDRLRVGPMHTAALASAMRSACCRR